MDFIQDWGLTAMVFTPIAGVVLMMLFPKDAEETHKVIAMVASLVTAGFGIAVFADFDFDATGTLQFVRDDSWIDVISARYLIGIDGLSVPLIALTLLTMLPAVVLLTTAFTRIIVVLGLLRHALGTGQTPSNQVLLGLALMLAAFVMRPVLDQIHSEAWQPYSEGRMSAGDAVQTALVPLRGFMLAQTRESSLQSLAEIAGDGPYAGPEAVPLTVLVPAFVLSELTTAFQIGFMLFIPFVVIDLVVASVLMSMGMMMLSPMLVSLPMKIMLFVLVDGWALLVGSLAESFR